MCEFLNAIFSLNFENFEKILFDPSVVPKMEWKKPPRSLILENDVFVDTLMYIIQIYIWSSQKMKIMIQNFNSTVKESSEIWFYIFS